MGKFRTFVLKVVKINRFGPEKVREFRFCFFDFLADARQRRSTDT
jgi:hypothetical protein